MRVICWPRARLRVLRSSRYNLKPALVRRGCWIHRALRNRHTNPCMLTPYSPRVSCVASSFSSFSCLLEVSFLVRVLLLLVAPSHENRVRSFVFFCYEHLVNSLVSVILSYRMYYIWCIILFSNADCTRWCFRTIIHPSIYHHRVSWLDVIRLR